MRIWCIKIGIVLVLHTRIPGADSGIEVKDAMNTICVRGSPGWVQGKVLLGPRERCSWVDFIGLKACLPKSHFYYISVII